MVIVVWPACWVCRPIAWSSSGRLVIASRCWSGSAKRTNRFHQLAARATMRAMNWQRLTSWGVKPPQPPLVFKFFEVVFGVAAVAIELGEGEQLGIQRGHQHGVFPSLLARVQ